jgi:hypothetical protein
MHSRPNPVKRSDKLADVCYHGARAQERRLDVVDAQFQRNHPENE